MTLDLINFVPNTKIKSSDVNTNFNQIEEELNLTQGTVTQLNTKVNTGTVPAGTVLAFAGQVAKLPDGYLVCDGSAVSRSTYATLYTAIGTTYGVGDGSTTFNLPSLTDTRYIQGNSTSGTYVSEQLPAIPSHTHSVSGTTAGNGGHSHSYSSPTLKSPTTSAGSGNAATSNPNEEARNTGAVSDHAHTFSVTSGDASATTGGAYTSGGHVYPKSVTMLYIIKY